MSVPALLAAVPNVTLSVGPSEYRIGLRRYVLIDSTDKDSQIGEKINLILKAIETVNGLHGENVVQFRQTLGVNTKVTFISQTIGGNACSCCTTPVQPIVFSIETPLETPEVDIHLELYMIVFLFHENNVPPVHV